MPDLNAQAAQVLTLEGKMYVLCDDPSAFVNHAYVGAQAGIYFVSFENVRIARACLDNSVFWGDYDHSRKPEDFLKIAAIKMIRSINNAGLAEAKAAMDYALAEYAANNPEPVVKEEDDLPITGAAWDVSVDEEVYANRGNTTEDNESGSFHHEYQEQNAPEGKYWDRNTKTYRLL